MIICGVDCSYSNTGISIIDTVNSQNNKILSKGFPPNLKQYRLASIFQFFLQIVQKYKVDIIIQQGYSFGSMFNRQAMGEFGGITKLAYSMSKVPYILVSPTTLKKFICGSGKSDKDRVRLQAYKKWGVDFQSNDQVDSYGLAKIGQAILTQRVETLNKYQQQAISTVMNNIQEHTSKIVFEKFNVTLDIVKKSKPKKRKQKNA